jgi:clusterin-associated protein 1
MSDDPSIDTEDDRVEFLTNIAQIMASRARIKLNPKRLYASDGKAVKELLKVAKLLYAAQKEVPGDNDTTDDNDPAPFSSKLKNIKETRALAGEIIEGGAKLYELLGQENELREARNQALRFLDSISSNLDSTSEHSFVEKSIRDIINNVTESAENLERQCSELKSDEEALDAKIKKKQADLERNEKRLRNLQSVRPAFMDEYEKLERELERQYEIYLERYRNLDFLEHEMDLYRQAEQERLKESNRRLSSMQAHLRQEELNSLRHDPDAKPMNDGLGRRRDDALGDDGLNMRRPGAANSVRRDGGRDERSNGNRIIGSMDHASDDSSDSSDGGSDVSDVSGDSSRSSKFSGEEDDVSMGGSNSVSGSSEDGSIDEDDSDLSDDDGQSADDSDDF